MLPILSFNCLLMPELFTLNYFSKWVDIILREKDVRGKMSEVRGALNYFSKWVDILCV